MSDDEKFDGVLLNMATQLEGGVPENTRSERKYRSYTMHDLMKAYRLVKDEHYPVQKAADQFGIPESTLRDRVKGKIPLSICRSGPAPALGMAEEEKLVDYLIEYSGFGYGFSRNDIINLATDYAVLLGKREPTDAFTHMWYYSFLKRWPKLEMQIVRASYTKKQFERAMSVDCLSQYFVNLQTVINKLKIMNKPESIYIVDEVLIDLDKSPPSVFSWRMITRWEKYKKRLDPTMTLIACANAAGERLPAFFIFPGKTVSAESIEDCAPGTGATCSDDGTTTCNVFQLFIDNHFLKFKQRPDNSEPILLLFDGHRTHISPALLDLYKESNLHLFPIPPGFSQMLVNINRGIFGDFETHFTEECDDFIETEIEKSIHSNVCVVASKAYNSALYEESLKDVFERAGIYPFKPKQINKNIDLSLKTLKKEKMIVVTKPQTKTSKRQMLRRKRQSSYSDENFEEVESKLFRSGKGAAVVKKRNYSNRRKSKSSAKKQKMLSGRADELRERKPGLKLKFVRDSGVSGQSSSGKRKSGRGRKMKQETLTDEDSTDEYETDSDSEIDEMLSSDDEDQSQEFEVEEVNQEDIEFASSQRKNFESALREELLSTHGLYFEGTQRERFEREFERAKNEFERTETSGVITADGEEEVIEEGVVEQVVQEDGQVVADNIVDLKNVFTEPTAGGDRVVETGPTVIIESVEEEIPMSETCCVCKKYHPEAAKEGYVVEFATWGKCEFDRCDHWTHLKYCCNVKVLRRHDTFYCPCHNQVENAL